jgi:hypothetical protein
VPGSDLCGFSMVLNTLKLDPRFEAPIEEGDYGWLGDPGFPLETYLDRDEVARFLGSESIESTASRVVPAWPRGRPRP